MNTRIWTIGIALLGLLPPSVRAVDAKPQTAVEAEGHSKSVINVQLSTRSAAAPLDMRVSVQYINSKAADMLQVLATAAGLTVDVPSGPLQPVTITLTNVRLQTALDAICDTAGCTWRLEGRTIKVASAGRPNTTSTLPATLSIELEQVSVRDVFRAIGAALNVPVTVEGQVDRPPLTVKFNNAPTTTVLDFICKNAGCVWDFTGTSLNVRFKSP